MVQHHVFGVDRDIDISKDEFFTNEELNQMEQVFTDLGCEHDWFPSTTINPQQQSQQEEIPCQLHYRRFLPTKDPEVATQSKSTPDAIIIFMHGLQSHCGVSRGGNAANRKTNMALLADEFTNKRNYALYCFDMIGHGFSEGTRFFLPSPNALIQDYINFVTLVASKHSCQNSSSRRNNQQQTPIPIFLAGESIGGNLTLHVARYYQDHPLEATKVNFQGCLLFSPAIMPDGCGHCLYPYVYCGIKYFLAPIMPMARPPSCIPHPVNAHRIWRDPIILQEATNSNIPVNRVFSGTGKHPHFRTMQTLMECMMNVQTIAIPDLNIPFCLVHGEQDLAVPITGSEYLRDHISTPNEDYACKIYNDALHDLLAEPEAPDVVQFVCDWIQQRIQKQEQQQVNTGIIAVQSSLS